MRYFFLLALLLITATGCRSKAEYARIPKSQLQQVERSANDGDIASARRLARHWLFGYGDMENARKWMFRAAELGDPIACKNLPGLGVTELPSACKSLESP